jgi:hypothetical protein
MREDGAELRLVRRACSRLHLDQIRPHGLVVRVLDPPDTRSWRDLIRAQESGLPSDRHPDRTKRAVVLEAVKVWPGKGGVRRKVGASANLDSSCARRFAILRVGAKKRNSRSNKETDQDNVPRSETA